MIAHLHKYVKFTSKIITCKTFLKNVLTYNFDYGTFKMQEQDRRSEYYAKIKKFRKGFTRNSYYNNDNSFNESI